eukprot:TRINITY_DN73089_c0_g1_i1.p1 TRINITY_DN73089_c0_g1~~TRINITY_DN73089_c0_g1_i1.p1  ORF type:complete len:250 (+),score=41.10 TRINITY_DN73089_c0_g1_i1:89-838(+)
MVESWLKGISACCNGCGVPENDQQVIHSVPNPTMDEYVLVSRSSPQGVPTLPDRPVVARSIVPDDKLIAQKDADEKKRQKERLQDIVREYVRAVVRGIECHWLPGSGDVSLNGVTTAIPAVYYCDKSLATFRVVPQDSKPIEISLGSVTDILVDARETPFASIDFTSQEDVDRRFVCLRYAAGGDLEADDAQNATPAAPLYLAMLMRDQYDAARFSTCMKILLWAIDPARDQSSDDAVRPLTAPPPRSP